MSIVLDRRSVGSENFASSIPAVRPSRALPTTRRVYQDIAQTISQQIENGEFTDGQLLPSERVLCT